MNTSHTASPYQSLLSDLLMAMGGSQALDDDLQGLEFDTGPHRVRVGPHPSRDTTLVVEVDVLDTHAALSAGADPHWRRLHQYNHASGLDLGWMASVDEDSWLVLTLQPVLSHVSASALQALMSEGLDQAEALAREWAGTPVPGDTAFAVSVANAGASGLPVISA